MNHGEARGSSGRRGGSGGRSPSSRHSGHRQDSGTPVTVDRSFGESCGSRGRGRYTLSSLSPINSPVKVWVKKSSPLSSNVVDRKSHSHQEDGIGSSYNQPDEVAVSGDNKDLLQSSASSVSRDCEDKDGAGMHCDPVNRIKDVSLSSQKKPVSSNESITRPFDLFLRTKVIGLKPSFLELNKDKRKATKGYTGSVIRPGMVLLKNYLSITDQVMILKKCRQLGLGEGGFYQPGYRDGASLHLKMMCLGQNWDPQTSLYGQTRPTDGSVPPRIPVEFNQFVEKAVIESQSLVASNSKKMKGEDEIPFMSPDICIANFYTSSGRLGLHRDKDESEKSIRKGLPVVSFSIGDSAEFLYGDQSDEDKAEMVFLESGDVLLFGGKSRNVFHGVRSIHKNTAPKVLVQETSLRPGRLNLTFRQY